MSRSSFFSFPSLDVKTEQVQIQLQDYDEQQRHLHQIAPGVDAESSPFGDLTRPTLRRHDAAVGGEGAGPYGGSSFDEEDEYLSQFSNQVSYNPTL